MEIKMSTKNAGIDCNYTKFHFFVSASTFNVASSSYSTFSLYFKFFSYITEIFTFYFTVSDGYACVGLNKYWVPRYTHPDTFYLQLILYVCNWFHKKSLYFNSQGQKKQSNVLKINRIYHNMFLATWYVGYTLSLDMYQIFTRYFFVTLRESQFTRLKNRQ